MPLASRPKTLRSLRPRSGTAAPRPRPARAGRATTADPITTEIILGAFETICYEMATHVSLTATTPILNQSNERNATILDGTGQLAALSVGIPQFMLSSTLPVRFAVEFFGEGGLFEGDVLVANDPYHGGGHLPDYNIFAPVFHDGACVLIASIQCHHADTGGGAPGGYNVNAPDIWAEGVRFPAVKIYEKGVKRRDVEYMMAVNNRTPTFLGDLRAQVGAAQLGVARLKEVLARFGPPTVEAAVRGIIAYAKRRFREEVAKWPDGVYESDAAGTHHPGTEVGEAVAKALEPVVPERSCPQVYKMGMPTVIFGTNPRDGKMFIDHSVDTFAAYCGAVKGQDGWGGMNVSFGNLIRATAEINESIFPIRQLWRDYDTDTGGAGEYRGNCGSLYRKQVLTPATIYTYVVGKRYPMPGIAGGRPGSPNRLIARAGGAHAFEVGDKAGYIEHAAGEHYEYHYGGGGGWGDPLRRSPERVLEDVLDEYVSVEGARRDYGVVLTGSLEELTLAVDHAATARLRAEMGARRGA